MLEAIIILIFVVIIAFVIWYSAQAPEEVGANESERVYNADASDDNVLEDGLVAEYNVAHSKIEELFEVNKDLLRRKRRRLITKDDYGFEDGTSWEEEKDYFVRKACTREEYPIHWKAYDNEVKDALESYQTWSGYPDSTTAKYESMRLYQDEHDRLVNRGLPWNFDWFKERLDEWLDSGSEEYESHFDDEYSGIDYEVFCAELFSESGWEANFTPTTGDQGADLICKNGNVRLVVQCKKSSRPVGNKAVQEVYAAKSFYAGKYAVVVTNKCYTASAKELARDLNVRLLHHDDVKAYCKGLTRIS